MAPCPFCNLDDGFHDLKAHAALKIPAAALKAKGWHKEDDQKPPAAR